MKRENVASAATNGEKKVWVSPGLVIISHADINSKSHPAAHEKSYQPVGGGKYKNPGFPTSFPKTVVTGYIS